MAVFRVERTRDYTVMCNHHLKDSNLSLKAKGLLSMMLSLPDEWNYTTRGLAAICKEGVDAIGKTLKELELAGYIIRRQLRGKDGRISDTEYTIFEKPRKPAPPDTTLPDTENPYLDNPDTEAPDTDNPAQLNTKKSNTQKSNTDLSSTHSFFLPAADGMTDGFEKKAEIREQIEYDILCQQYDRMQLDELVEIMLEVAMNRSPTVKIGRDAEYPTGFVQQRFEKITSMHIEKVMDGIRENTTRVWNTKAYLMAALFNSVSTIDNHYAMLVNHDFHGGPSRPSFFMPDSGRKDLIPMKRPLAYITAPWSENEFENTENAAKYCRAVYDAGFSPVCPTLFLPLFLRDEIPQEHKDCIDMAREYLRRARVLVVCGSTVNESVKNDIAVAERLRITATTLDGILTVKGQGRRNE